METLSNSTEVPEIGNGGAVQRHDETKRAPRVVPWEALALVVVWAAVIAIFCALRPESFATVANARTILGSQAILVVLALGLTVVLISGDLDLSVGATLGLSAILTAKLNVDVGLPVGLAALVGIGAGALVGAANGLLVVKMGIDALVATLGVATLVTGITYALTDYLIVSGVDRGLIDVMTARPMGIPLNFVYGMVLVAVVSLALSLTRYGRSLSYVGGNREAARLSGLNVTRLRFGAFIVCGALAALAGVMLTGFLGSADPGTGTHFLLPAFAAAFLGSTSIRPGHFNPWGTVVAVYFLATGITGLQFLGLPQWIQEIFYGGSLIVAVALARFAAVRRR
ncbi:MAG: ABC-type transporter, integral rane subunit [Actinomycetia bacterium]|nr:ABC-type transporter, integral rane subunit [Actinomycetes bacterium]